MATTTNEPDFRMADSHGYILSRGRHLATARLTIQHFLWHRILRFNIHPQIASHLPASPVIAEIGSGTALWAIEVSHEHPSATIHGYDVDLAQAPSREWLPDNVQLHNWDVFQDPPTDLVGNFDLVHIRLFVLVLSGHDITPVLQRLMSLLKPGGWLQWEDLDCTHMHVKKISPTVSTPSLDAIIEMSRSGGRHDWAADLPEILKGVGLTAVKTKDYDDPVEMSRALNDQHLMTMEEFAAGLAAIDKVEAAEKLLDLVKTGHNEAQAGAAICFPRLCVFGRKSNHE